MGSGENLSSERFLPIIAYNTSVSISAGVFCRTSHFFAELHRKIDFLENYGIVKSMKNKTQKRLFLENDIY